MSFKKGFINFRLQSTFTPSKMQVFTQKRNPITGSTEWDVQHEDYDYHQEIARSAFADMLHDTERNKKYYRALQLAIEKMHNQGKKANVLDIGRLNIIYIFNLQYYILGCQLRFKIFSSAMYIDLL